MQPDPNPYKLFCYKNEKHEFIQCSDQIIKCAGVKNADQVLGKTDYQFPWNEYAELYHKHEADVLAGKAYSTLIPLIDYNKRKNIFLHTKYCEYDAAGNFARMVCYATELVNPAIYQFEHLLAKKNPSKFPSYQLENKVLPNSLNTCEHQVLFFLLHGKSSKKIAEILDLSIHTIDKYIESIKYKLHCHTKAELCDYALKINMLTVIPCGILLKKLLAGLEHG